MKVRVLIQEDDFDVSAVLAALRQGDLRVGALCSFVGTVRDTRMLTGQSDDQVVSMTLEHYPGMTEKALEDIVGQARERWQLHGVRVIHRVGRLSPGDAIVLVVAASAHRGEAFAACEFIMDYLKTRAPFWKKEHGPDGARWIEPTERDLTDASRWDQAVDTP